MARPKKDNDKRETEYIGIRLTKELYRWFAARATKNGRSKSGEARFILSEIKKNEENHNLTGIISH